MTDDTELGLLLQQPFPEPEPAASTPVAPRARRALRRPTRTTTVAVIVVLLLAGGGGVWAATGSSAATYRWATASRGDVDQTLDSYGTVQPINQASVAFPVGGTVASVPVTLGQHVVSGQTLAGIELSSLQAKLDSSRSTLATAEAKLVTDTQAQATGSTVSASSSTGTSGTLGPAGDTKAVLLKSGSGDGTGGGNGSAATKAAQDAVTAAQNKLLADQKTVDSLTAAVAADLRSGTATCASLISALQGLGTSGSPTPAPSPSPGTGGGTGTTQVPDSSACTALLNKVLADQQAVSAAQATVSSDETALTSAVVKLVSAAQAEAAQQPSTPGTGTGTGSGTGSSGGSVSGSGSGSGTGRGGGGTTVSAAQLVVDQAQVDADAADVTVAEQALKQATIVSPLAGTVAAINVKAGSTVSASSTAVTVIGAGVDQVMTTVGDLDLDKIHVGAHATVTPDGTNEPVSGTVTAIGLLPVSTGSSSASSGSTGSGRGTGASSAASSSSSGSSSTAAASSSASYPVTISLGTGGLYSGSGAEVSILVKRSTNVVTVPTSAVTSLGPLHTVTALAAGKAVRRVVVIGATGPTLTQVTSGLKAGDRVVLARMDEPVPSSGSTNLTGRGGGLGRTAGVRLGTGGGGGFGGGGAVVRPGG